MKNLILMLLFVSGFLHLRATENGILSGRVTNEFNGSAVGNTAIGLFISGRAVAGTLSSASNGSFSISVAAGTYELRARAEGYQVKVMRNINVRSGANQTVSVTLKPSIDEVNQNEPEMFAPPIQARVSVNRSREAATGMGYADYAYDMPPVNYNTESYDLINENIFKEVMNNPLSTFSVDVDNASYSNVRRFFNQNQKPPVDAVRIEEMINYFDYDYPQPTDGHPFSVTVESSDCPWNAAHRLVLIGLKGENVNENDIPPNNLVFLIDVSGSMYGANRLPLVKQAFKFLVEQLRPQDKVAIVVYAGSAGLVLESTPGTQKARIVAAIDRLEAGGSTAGGAGIRLAYNVAKQNFIPNGNNRVILASDGDFNVGASSNAELVRLIEEKRDDGVFLTILGFGMGNYKDSRFKQLSMAGNGNFFYIDNILEAKKVFGVDLWGTLYTIAKDVKIQVEFNPAKVKAYRLIGYENRILNNEDFNNDKKDAGDIGCGHTVTAIYEIIPAGTNTDIPGVDPLRFQNRSLISSNDFMHVKIRYKKPNEDTSILIERMIRANQMRTGNNILFASAIAEFGMLLRNSEHKGTASFSSLLERAKRSKGADEHGFRSDFIKMVEIAEMLYF